MYFLPKYFKETRTECLKSNRLKVLKLNFLPYNFLNCYFKTVINLIFKYNIIIRKKMMKEELSKKEF